MEEIADDHLGSDEREDGYADAQAMGRHADERFVRSEYRSDGMGEQLTDDEPAGGDAHTRNDTQAQGTLHAVQHAGTEIVAHDGLHAHRQSDYNHDVEHQQAVDNAVGADGHVASMVSQAVVDEDDDGAGRDVHQERRHADGEDAAHDAPLQSVEVAMQADGVGTPEEVVQYPQRADELRDDRSQCCPLYAPAELENEEGSEDDVGHHGGKRCQHGLLRMARGTHNVVQPDHGVGDGRAQQNDLHEVAGIGQGIGAGSEEAQNVVEKNECQSTKHDSVDETEHQGIAQHLVHSLHVLLPQTDGRDGGAAGRYQIAEGCRQVHQREGDGQTCNGHGTHAVADEDAVDDVVQRHDGHADDGGDGILQQQFPNAFCTEQMRIVHKQS